MKLVMILSGLLTNINLLRFNPCLRNIFVEAFTPQTLAKRIKVFMVDGPGIPM
jgi:hypothetical protein